MYCKNCGQQIDDKAVICIHCGCSVEKEAGASQNNTDGQIVNLFGLIGFILSVISLFISLYGVIAIAGLILSIVGLVQVTRGKGKFKGFGIAGIVISAISLIFTIIVLVTAISLLSII